MCTGRGRVLLAAAAAALHRAATNFMSSAYTCNGQRHTMLKLALSKNHQKPPAFMQRCKQVKESLDATIQLDEGSRTQSSDRWYPLHIPARLFLRVCSCRIVLSCQSMGGWSCLPASQEQQQWQQLTGCPAGSRPGLVQ